MAKPEVSGSTSMKTKLAKGKRKIEIKKIEKTTSRHVAFSKRRAGLFKKAAETCILTGAQIAVLVTSSKGRVYAFGHPHTDAIVDRYHKEYPTTTETTEKTTKKSPPALHIEEFNQHYEEVSRESEAEKKRGNMIPVRSGGLRWYEEAVDGLDMEELQEFLWSLEDLKTKVLMEADDLMMISKSSVCFCNNSIQPVDIPTDAVDGGLHVQYAGDDEKF